MDISAFLVIPPSMGFQWLLRKAWGMTIPLDPKFSASEMLTAASRAYCKSGIQDSWIQHRQNGIDIKSLENPCYHPIFYPILTGLENHVPWLVVYLPLWKIWKSIGMMTFPIWWESHKIPWFQTTKQFPIFSLWKHGHFSQRSSAAINMSHGIEAIATIVLRAGR